jgi:shikimate kinase
MKIFLLGFMGAGKTHWGRQLSAKMGIPFFDLDEQVVNAEGHTIAEIFELNGEECFREKEKEILHIITESHSSFVMATGGGTPCYFNNVEYMNQSGTTVWIHTPAQILFNRLLKEKDHRPLLKNLSTDQLMGFITKKYGDRTIYYEQASIIIEDEEIALEKFIDKIFHGP